MGLLLAASVGLGVGPLLQKLAQRQPSAQRGVEGLLLGLLIGFLGLEVLPASIEVTGLWALVFALMGFGLSRWTEQLTSIAGKSPWILGLALGGLLVHCLLDGWVLRHHPTTSSALALTLAIVIHRIPVGLVVWQLASRHSGTGTALGALLAMAGITIVGYSVGFSELWPAQDTTFANLQAFIAGMILHVIRDQPTSATLHSSPVKGGSTPDPCCHDHHHDRIFSLNPAIEAGGFFMGVAITAGAAAIVHPITEPHVLDSRFALLWWQTSPALLLGFISAGLVTTFLPAAPVSWIQRGGRLSQATRGVIFGLPIPICSCGIVPVYRSLIKRSLPLPAALAFLVSAPELGLEAVLLTIPLLGGTFAATRVIAAAILAISMGYIVGSFATRSSTTHIHSASPELRPSSGSRWIQATRYAFIEVVDDIMLWLLIGLLIAAAVPNQSLSPLLTQIPETWHVPLAAILGIPIYVCASGATPIAAAFITAGLSPGAGLAFLLSGPSTNVTTFGLLSSAHGRTVAILFGATMITGASILGWIAGSFLPLELGQELLRPEETFGLLSYSSGLVVAGLFAFAVVRRGPKALLRLSA